MGSNQLKVGEKLDHKLKKEEHFKHKSNSFRFIVCFFPSSFQYFFKFKAGLFGDMLLVPVGGDTREDSKHTRETWNSSGFPQRR